MLPRRIALHRVANDSLSADTIDSRRYSFLINTAVRSSIWGVPAAKSSTE